MPRDHEVEEGLRFDQFAANYDQSESRYPLRTQVRNKAVEVVRNLSPAKVCDAGCGTGAALFQLADSIQFGVGLYISRKMVEVAHQNRETHKATNLRFMHASLMDIVDDCEIARELDSTDVVLSTYALHHLAVMEKKQVIKALASVVSEGGTIVLGDLMFFDDPKLHVSDFGLVGYDPSTDKPEHIETLVETFEYLDFTVRMIQVHALAGVLVASREKDNETS